MLGGTVSSLFDRAFAPIDSFMGAMRGEAVEYTFLDGRTVTDERAFMDAIESGYEVDAGQRTSQDERGGNRRGVAYQSRKTFGLRKSVIGEAEPEIYAKVRVVAEGSEAAVWTVWRIIGSEAARWYLECERATQHERSRENMRGSGH